MEIAPGIHRFRAGLATTGSCCASAGRHVGVDAGRYRLRAQPGAGHSALHGEHRLRRRQPDVPADLAFGHGSPGRQPAHEAGRAGRDPDVPQPGPPLDREHRAAHRRALLAVRGRSRHRLWRGSQSGHARDGAQRAGRSDAGRRRALLAEPGLGGRGGPHAGAHLGHLPTTAGRARLRGEAAVERHSRQRLAARHAAYLLLRGCVSATRIACWRGDRYLSRHTGRCSAARSERFHARAAASAGTSSRCLGWPASSPSPCARRSTHWGQPWAVGPPPPTRI